MKLQRRLAINKPAKLILFLCGLLLYFLLQVTKNLWNNKPQSKL